MAELRVLLLVIFYFVCVAELFAALVVRLFFNYLVSYVIIVLNMAELHVLLLVIFCSCVWLSCLLRPEFFY